MIKDGFIEVNKGIKVYYKAIIKNHPWVIFLHGGTGTSASLLQQEQYFSKTDFSVLFIDFRGHGRSDKGQGKEFFRIDRLVDDVRRVMKEQGITEAILAGHCMGSFVAQEFAEHHPELLSGLVLINSSTGMKRSLPMHLFLELLFMSIRYLPIKGKKEHPDYRKHFGSIDLSPGRLYTDLIYAGAEMYSRVFLESIHYNPAPHRSFSGPVLIIHGKHDSIINPKQAAVLGTQYKNAQVRYLDTNHCSVINDAQNVNEAVLEFAKRIRTIIN